MPSFSSSNPISSKEKKSDRQSVRIISSVLMVLNILSIICTILFLLDLQMASFLHVFGVVLLLTFIGNIVVAALPSHKYALDQGYLLFTILAMTLLPVINTVASSNPSNQASTSWLSSAMLFVLLGFGAFVAWTKRARSNSEFVGVSSEAKQSIRALVALILLALCLLVGMFVTYQLIVGKTGGAVEMFFPGYALFFSIGTLAITALLLKRKRTKTRVSLAIVGIVIAVSFSAPVVSTLFTLNEAEQEFSGVFGEDWEEGIPDEVSSYFLNTPFSLPHYFFGTRTEDYTLKENILFYEGVEGVDEDIRLYFDSYLPPENGNDLPGNRAVLIRIHGGGWTIGDKGSGNNAEVNKYFASQGYVVFDVQYGLSSEDKFVEFAPVPDNIVADFTIDDMVRHIGIFTNYLVEYNDDFKGDLDRVFVSGPSAGGQLANAVGLGLASGQFTDILNPALKVKGIIPVYPANGLARNVGIDGTDELIDPALLVTENSPPALIFQGTADGVVDSSIATKFDETYLNQNNNGSILFMMPFAGHNGDFYFSNYYNQIFMYYMERFMYLNQ
ncbi:alpha/beta hydrolase [Bacillus sp. AK128]